MKEIFLAAADLPEPERAAYLDLACQGDRVLRRKIDSLLLAHAAPGDFTAEYGLAPPPVNPLSPIGSHVGPYKLLQQLGEGGMGIVYLAEQTHPVQRRVALKLIKAGMDSRQVVARFEAERQALAMMDHVNIARVLDAGATEAGQPYFVMELVDGVPITRYCDDNHLTPRDRLTLFVSVCQAIQHAHQRGIIHRDIKPSNVMVTLADGKPIPKVIDFGVAKATEQRLTERTLFTQSGTLIGTLEYMSPEQAEMSESGVDTRSDVYSLGVLLYELLTGSTPLLRSRLRDAAYGEVMRLIRDEDPPKPSTRLINAGDSLLSIAAQRHMEPARLAKLVRGDLDWIVMKTLDKDRNRRYESASGLAFDVQRYLADEPVQACPPSAAYRTRKFVRRNRAAVITGLILGLAALTVLGVVAGGLGWMAHERSTRQQILTREVEQALQEANELAERAQTLTDNPYQWDATLAAASSALKRAEGLAAQDKEGLSPTIRDRLVSQRARLDADEKDRRFIARFEGIRLEQSEVHTDVSKFKLEVAFPTLNEAFRTYYGIEFGVTPPDEFVTFLQRRPGPIRDSLICALDVSFAQAPRHEESIRQWLATVLQSADSNPWRQRVRAAAQASNWPLLSTLLREGISARQPSVVLTAFAEHVPWEEPCRLEVQRSIQEANPGDFWANINLALALHLRKNPQFEEAIRYYTAAIALRPRNPATHVNMANALRGKGDFNLSSAAHHRALEIAPDYPAAHLSLGYLLKTMGNPDGAKEAYRNFAKFTTDPAEANFQAALIYHSVDHNLDAAIAAYRETIRLRPNASLAARFNIGMALATLGRPEEAIAAYREVIQLSPKYVKARIRLGNLLEERGRLDEAIELYREGISLSPRSFRLHHELGWAYRA